MIINAENLVVGRMGTFAAKKALLGEKIDIINCEKAIIVGGRKDIISKYKHKINRGTQAKGPFIPKLQHMFVKRIIRGMLPHKQYRGMTAFKKIKCYVGVPDQFKQSKHETIEAAKTKNLNFITIDELCKQLGAK